MRFDRVFITGGASGLGAALAKQLAAAGSRVCIGDVDVVANKKTCFALDPSGERAHFLTCDVTREEDFTAAAEWLSSRWGGVDLVVNNAGVAQMGPIGLTSLADWQWTIDINLLSVVRSCRVFVPQLRAQGGGTILNIASMSAKVYLPDAGAYNATKAAVAALSETLELELAPDNIQVHVACPTFFRSGLAQHMRASDERSKTITKRMVERARLSAEETAALILEGLSRGESIILPNKEGRRTWRLKRWLPHSLWLRNMRKQLAKLNARFQRKEAAQ